MSDENIEPLPLRLDMPPEIAAIALPAADGSPPTVVLNAAELDQRATFSLFKLDVYVAALFGWLASQAGRIGRQHQAATAVIATVAVGSVAVVGVNTALVGHKPTMALPAPTVTVVATQAPATLTLPPIQQTVTATAAAPRTRRSSAPPVHALLSPTSAPARKDPATRPAATPVREPEPTSKASKAPSPRPAATQAQDAASQDMVPAPSSSRTGTRPSEVVELTPTPSTENPPTNQDCIIEVGVDPLLDVCIR